MVINWHLFLEYCYYGEMQEKRHMLVPVDKVGWFVFLAWVYLGCVCHKFVGFDHIDRNPPVLIRTPKLTRSEPAQYWGGGPPGNSVVLNPLLFFLLFFHFSFRSSFLNETTHT